MTSLSTLPQESRGKFLSHSPVFPNAGVSDNQSSELCEVSLASRCPACPLSPEGFGTHSALPPLLVLKEGCKSLRPRAGRQLRIRTRYKILNTFPCSQKPRGRRWNILEENWDTAPANRSPVDGGLGVSWESPLWPVLRIGQGKVSEAPALGAKFKGAPKNSVTKVKSILMQH